MGSGGGNSSSGGTPPVVLVKKESEKSLWIVAGLVGTAFVYSLWRVD